MTSHHDVAVVVAELRTVADRIDASWAFTPLRQAADLLESQAKALSEAERYLRGVLIHFVNEHCEPIPEWKPLPDLLGMLTQFDNASTVARELEARALAAEARLAEAMKVIEPFVALVEAIECTTLHAYSDDETWSLDNGANIVKIGHLRAARAFTNAAKEKT